MGQFFGQETLTEIIRVDNSTVRLPSGSYIRLGGQAYRLNTNLDLDTGTVGAGGLESAVQANTIYYVYAVFDSSDVKLIGSTSKIMPSGFASYKKVGLFVTDNSFNVSYTFFLGIDGNKRIELSEECHYHEHAGYGSTNTVCPYYVNEDFNNISTIGEVNNSSLNGFNIVVKLDCEVKMVTGARDNSGAGFGVSGISKNSNQLTTYIADIDPVDRIAFNSYSAGVSNGNTLAHAVFGADINDIIRVHNGAYTPTDNVRSYVRVLLKASLN